MSEFFSIWLNGFLVSMAFLTLLWLISVFLKNASIIDPFWGTGFIILAIYYQYATQSYNNLSWLLVGLVILWGARLSIYLLWRNMGKGEDYRYQQFRKDYGPKRYWWFSFFQVFLLQGVIMSIVALPVLGSLVPTRNFTLSPLMWFGLLFWLIGFIFEAGGDYQMARFKRTKKSGDLLNTGLWRYTRHPNYFGNAMIWWGIGLFSVSNGYYLPLLGPILMNFLLLRVSGVSMLERSLKTKKSGYDDYIATTSAFIPRPPKKLSQ